MQSCSSKDVKKRPYTYTHTRTRAHKRCKSHRAISMWFNLDNANAQCYWRYCNFQALLTRKVLNEKVHYYSLLKISRNKDM